MAIDEPSVEDEAYLAMADFAWPELMEAVKSEVQAAGVELEDQGHRAVMDRRAVMTVRDPTKEALRSVLRATERFGNMDPDADVPLDKVCASSITIIMVVSACTQRF